MAAFSIINDLEEFLKTWKGAKGYKPPPGQPMPFTGQVPPTATVPRPMAFKPQPAPQTPPTPQPRPVGPEAWKGAGPTVPALRSPQLVGPKLGPASGETPQSSARPFSQDYPGAKGRLGDPLTQDIEGRPLEAPAIAGRQTFGGRDVPLTAQQIHDLALKGLTELPILKDLGMRVGGQFLGSTPWASPLMRQIQINSRLSPEQRMRTFAHETAHMIDHMAGGHTGSLPIDLAEMERVYKDASEAGAGTTPGFRGYKGRKIYPEYIAEGLRAYLTNPGYFKTVAPKTAKMFRDAINTTPALRKIVQLNIIPLLAVGVGELAGGGEAKAEEEGKEQTIDVNGAPITFPAGMPREEMEHAISSYLARKKIAPSGEETTKTLLEVEKQLPGITGMVSPGQRFKMSLSEGFETAARGLNQIHAPPGQAQVPPEPLPAWVKAAIGGETPGAEKANERAYQVAAGIGNVAMGVGEAAFSVLDPIGQWMENALGRDNFPYETVSMAAGMISPSTFFKTLPKLKAAVSMAPSADIIMATGNDLFKLRNWVTADKIDVFQHLKSMPPEFKTGEMQAKFYAGLEKDPAVTLTPEEQKIFDSHIEPMRKEIQQLQAIAKDIGHPLQDNEWVHRVLEGFEPLPSAHGAAESPQMGTRTLPRKTTSQMERTFHVLEAADGRRAVVSQRPGTDDLTVWNKGTPTPLAWKGEISPGRKVSIAGQDFTVKHGRTSELEAETPARYRKNAAANMAIAVVKMRQVVRDNMYLDRLTKSKEWRLWATKNKSAKPGDWRKTDIPQLEDWYVHPRLANVFDDFHNPNLENKGTFDGLRRINRFAVGSLFWNPTPHIENVAGHWAVGRGFDWLRPTGWHSLMVDGGKAIKSVITLDQNYQNMLKHGSALISGGVQNPDFYRAVAKKFGMDIQRDPRWMQIANKLGMRVPDLVRAVYAGSNRVMWQANDILMMQRVLELERKGLSRTTAIKDAEKHIPNYRIPPEVMGSRAFSKAMQDPMISAFGRYHYGVWNSYTNMVRDLTAYHDPKRQIEAVGNLMALGALTFGVYPAVSWGLQRLTGDDDISKTARGPSAIPMILYKSMTDGEKQWYDIIGSSITLAPVLKEIGEQTFDRDFYTGRHIEEPGETSVARRVAQRIGHVVNTMAAPAKQVEQMARQIDEKGVPRAVLDQAIGTEDKTAEQTRGAAKGAKYDIRASKARRRKPQSLIEEFEGSFE